MRTVVLDTNVLLADPESLLSYPDAEVIIPETVLGEIDKLKTSRVDPDLRFRGREVSRMLFELSEDGSLIDGVDLPDGGRLRIVPLDSDTELPEGLSARNADDRILAVAYSVCASGCEDLTLVTNDLNMLLKAQTYGIKVERRADTEGGFGRRYIIRPFQRYKVPIAILAIAVAVFAGVFALAFYTSSLTSSGASIPDEFRDALTPSYRSLLDGLLALESNPDDMEATKQVADAYYDLYQETGSVGFAQAGIKYYTTYLQSNPGDLGARVDMSVLYFYTGSTDRAIQEITTVLETDPSHMDANFNLGIFYWQGRSDYDKGAIQLMKVVDLAQESTDAHAQIISANAKAALQQLQADAAAAGVTIDIDPKYLPQGNT